MGCNLDRLGLVHHTHIHTYGAPFRITISPNLFVFGGHAGRSQAQNQQMNLLAVRRQSQMNDSASCLEMTFSTALQI